MLKNKKKAYHTVMCVVNGLADLYGMPKDDALASFQFWERRLAGVEQSHINRHCICGAETAPAGKKLLFSADAGHN